MNILAMDTSSVNATVALCDGSRILGEYTVAGNRAHSQIIMPMLDTLLTRCNLSINEIDVFAVALGPGSFTGLRIGIAAMKTFASSLGKKIIGISALDEVAANFSYTDKYICPIFDARRNDVYNAIYLNGEKLIDDRICDFNIILDELKFKEVIFTGDAIYKYSDKINSMSNPKWMLAPMHLSMQNASSLAYLAAKKAMNNEFDDPDTLMPIYIRPSQAEREYMETHKDDKI